MNQLAKTVATDVANSAPGGRIILSAEEFQGLADMPQELEWFGAAASVVWAATTSRENDPIHGFIIEGFKLTFHGIAAKVNGLNLKGCPIHWSCFRRLRTNQNHVDAAYIIPAFAVGRRAGFKESDFTNKQRVGVTKDGFPYPIEHTKFIMESVWTCGSKVSLLPFHRYTDRPSVVWVCVIGVKPERTNSAIFGANRAWFACLEWAWLRGSFFLRLENFGGKLAALLRRKLCQVETKPLSNSESWRDVFCFFAIAQT